MSDVDDVNNPPGVLPLVSMTYVILCVQVYSVVFAHMQSPVSSTVCSIPESTTLRQAVWRTRSPLFIF